jgi:integrase/recombinase XerD
LQQIKKKKTKRLSPYLETEVRDRDELLKVVKYEPYIRNKAALTLFWDLDATNHEVTMLKIKHILLRERYGEGEVPHEVKNRWRTNPAYMFLSIGSPIRPEDMENVMKQLKKRIESRVGLL